MSITSIVKEANQAWNENRKEAYRVSDSRKTIARELFLFETGESEDLNSAINSLVRIKPEISRGQWLD